MSCQDRLSWGSHTLLGIQEDQALSVWFAIRLAATSKAPAAQPSPNCCTYHGARKAWLVTGMGRGQGHTALSTGMTILMREIHLSSAPRVPSLITPILSWGSKNSYRGDAALPPGLQV